MLQLTLIYLIHLRTQICLCTPKTSGKNTENKIDIVLCLTLTNKKLYVASEKSATENYHLLPSLSQYVLLTMFKKTETLFALWQK